MTSCQKQRSSRAKVIKYLFVAVLVIGIIFAAGARSPEKRISDFTQLASVYDELQAYSEFASLEYTDGRIIIRYADGSTDELESDRYPQTKNLLSSGTVHSIFKQGDNAYFVIGGFADNYCGYILSQDTQVEMEEITTAERLVNPCKYKVFYFTAQ